MKGKWKQRVLAFLTSAALVALIAIPVQARGTNYTPGANNAADKKFTFNKDLEIENEYSIPAATFTFTLSAGTAKDATDGKLPVYAGIGLDKIVFTPDVDTVTGAGTLSYSAHEKTDTTGIAADNITIIEPGSDANHYIARKTVTMDFSAVKFTEPGVYRYILTESGSNTAVQNDDITKRTLDVYVEDDKDSTGKELKILGFAFYEGVVEEAPGENNKPVTDPETKKSEGYLNHYPATGLTFGKEVKGNQGSKDQYFKFTLNVTLAQPGTIFTVNYSKADESISANPNAATKCIPDGGVTQPATFAANADGDAQQDFFLQDGQYITVYGFIEGVKYTLSEENAGYDQSAGIAKEDSSLDIDGDTKNDALSDPVSATFTKDANDKLIPRYTGFTNTKEGLVPTGVILSVAPWAIAGIVLVAGIAFFMIRSRRRYEEN